MLAALVWGVSAVLGFQQFGLPTVLFGMALAYSGTLLYSWRRWSDRRRSGERRPVWSLHTKLTGAMLLVMMLDGAGYLLAVKQVQHDKTSRCSPILQDIFVAVALLTITVGLVLPGMVAHAAEEVARSAARLATGTLADFSRIMQALGRGDLDAVVHACGRPAPEGTFSGRNGPDDREFQHHAGGGGAGRERPGRRARTAFAAAAAS